MKKRVVARTVVISIICMLLFGAYAYYQIDKYEEGMAEIYSEEQDGYVALVSEKIKSGDKVVEDAQDTVELLKSADDHSMIRAQFSTSRTLQRQTYIETWLLRSTIKLRLQRSLSSH